MHGGQPDCTIRKWTASSEWHERARRELFHETWSIRAGEDRSARLRPIKAHHAHNKPKSTMLTATPIMLPANKNMNNSYNMTCASQ
jgi:hypothetical protein